MTMTGVPSGKGNIHGRTGMTANRFTATNGSVNTGSTSNFKKGKGQIF